MSAPTRPKIRGDRPRVALVLSGGGGLSTYATLNGDVAGAKAACAEAFALYARIGDRRVSH